MEVLERVLELCSKIVVSLAKVAGDEKTATAAVRKLSLSSSSLLLHPDNAAATPSSKFDTIFSSLLNQPDVVPILTLLAESTELYSAYRNHFLDNLLVSIVSPVFKSLTQLWDPLSEPRFACQWLKTHRRLLVLDEVDWYSSSLQEDDIMDIDEDNGPLVPSFGSRTRHYRRSGTAPSPSTASPYESLLYNIWLPRIRSALNNRWVVVNPDPAIALIDSWHPTTEYTHHEKGPFGEGSKIHGELPNLPAFASQKCLMPYWMYLNIVDQIILPKLSSYILQVWDPRELIGIRGGGGGISPHTWIHPWLPYIDAQRIDAHVFTHLRYKLGMLFRQLSNMNSTRSSTSTQPITSASTGLLSLVLPYKDVWSSETMNTFISKSVLPFLAALVRR